MSTDALSRDDARRLQRLSECWHADEPSEAEIRRAVRRMAWRMRRPAPRTPWPRILALVAASSLGTSAALAVTGALRVPAPLAALLPAPEHPSSPAAEVAARPRIYRKGGGQPQEVPAGVPVQLGAAEQVTVVVGSVSTELTGPGMVTVGRRAGGSDWVVGFEHSESARAGHTRPSLGIPAHGVPPPASAGVPGLVPPQLEPGRAGGDAAGLGRPRGTSGSSQPAPPEATPREEGASPGLDGSWSQAAKALREGDERGATRAFSTLAHSEDPVTRDAALLARAQLDVAAGRREEALPLLRFLSLHGATELVRRRAAEVMNAPPGAPSAPASPPR